MKFTIKFSGYMVYNKCITEACEEWCDIDLYLQCITKGNQFHDIQEIEKQQQKHGEQGYTVK